MMMEWDDVMCCSLVHGICAVICSIMPAPAQTTTFY